MQIHTNEIRHSIKFQPETKADGPFMCKLLKAVRKLGPPNYIFHSATSGMSIEIPTAREWPEIDDDRPDWQKTSAARFTIGESDAKGT